MGRRQIEIERALLARGMPPRQAAETAARQVMPPRQEREYESFPPPRTVADTSYEGYTDEELATIYRIEAEREMVGQPYSQSRQTNVRQALRDRGVEAGNGADVDNLAGAATAFGMEPDLGGSVSQRGFSEWANATPGTERQARYAPAEYEQFREGARQDIQDRARADAEKYGTGPDDNGRRARMDLAALTPDQETNRADRAESEDRVRRLQRGDFYEDRLAVDGGTEPPEQAGPRSPAERAAFRQRYAARQEELASRKQALIRTRMAQTNPLEYMNRDDISDWNRFAAAQSVLGGRVRGATPNDVAAARNEQLTALGLRVAQGQGFQQSPPGQAELIEQKLNEGKPVQVRAQEAVAAGRVNDPTILQYADDLVHSNYSSRPGMLGVSTHFTDNEVGLAAQRLAADTGLKLPEALQVMRRIQEDRNRNSQASSIASFFYDQ
jgi:hypothetical protein